MYLERKEANDLLKKTKEEMLSDLEAHSDFLLNLLDEDDWSFVIKAHAMIEASSTNLIIQHVGETDLRRLIERLPLSDSRTGKIVALRDMSLAKDSIRKFIVWFSALRNDLVHKLENVSFTFDNHVSEMDKNQKKSWANQLTFFADGKEIRDQWRQIANENPKVSLFMCLLHVVTDFSLQARSAESRRRIDTAAVNTTSALMKNDEV